MEIDFKDDSFLFNFSFVIFGLAIIANTILGDMVVWLSTFNLLVGSFVVIVSLYNLYKGNLNEREHPRWASYVVLVGAFLMLLLVSLQVLW